MEMISLDFVVQYEIATNNVFNYNHI